MTSLRSFLQLLRISCAPLLLWSAAALAQRAPAARTVQEIIREASLPGASHTYPLPLLGSWSTGVWPDDPRQPIGLAPGWQLDMIAKGHHLLPWFGMPDPDPAPRDESRFTGYFEQPWREIAAQGLPVTFIGTQWEHLLYDDSALFRLPAERNPNVVTPAGEVLKRLSPFGPVEPWYQVGRRWGASAMLHRLIAAYPQPPLVIFVSNNEASRLEWRDVEQDRRYLAKYGRGRSDDFKRTVVADGWIERYRALQRGFRDALENPAWRQGARFMAYSAVGPPHVGRWSDWKRYSLYVPGRLDPSALMWDGGSASFYLNPGSVENAVAGVLMGATNYPFEIREARALNPAYWFMLSIWDGGARGRSKLRDRGELFTPARYGGMVQFGMWLTRPRLVQEFRGWREPRDSIAPWIMPLAGAVDRVYADPVLRSFWREGELVPNRTRTHPYQVSFPAEFASADRSYLLTTSVDPPVPWTLNTTLPVFSFALVKSTAPHRQWLVYAYAPLGPIAAVGIDIPGANRITVTVPVEGAFYRVDEAVDPTSPSRTAPKRLP